MVDDSLLIGGALIGGLFLLSRDVRQGFGDIIGGIGGAIGSGGQFVERSFYEGGNVIERLGSEFRETIIPEAGQTIKSSQDFVQEGFGLGQSTLREAGQTITGAFDFQQKFFGNAGQSFLNIQEDVLSKAERGINILTGLPFAIGKTFQNFGGIVKENIAPVLVPLPNLLSAQFNRLRTDTRSNQSTEAVIPQSREARSLRRRSSGGSSRSLRNDVSNRFKNTLLSRAFQRFTGRLF